MHLVPDGKIGGDVDVLVTKKKEGCPLGYNIWVKITLTKFGFDLTQLYCGLYYRNVLHKVKHCDVKGSGPWLFYNKEQKLDLMCTLICIHSATRNIDT